MKFYRDSKENEPRERDSDHCSILTRVAALSNVEKGVGVGGLALVQPGVDKTERGLAGLELLVVQQGDDGSKGGGSGTIE